MKADKEQNTIAVDNTKGLHKKSLTIRQLLFIEKCLFIVAVAIAEFYMFIKFGGLQWVANENILLIIAPPFAIAGIWVRRYRKSKLKKKQL
jgi:hypothetical protein